LIGNEEEFFYNFLEKYRIYLAARGSIFETQKQTIPEQKRNQKNVRTTERARSDSVSGTHTHTHTHTTSSKRDHSSRGAPENLTMVKKWVVVYQHRTLGYDILMQNCRAARK
jgi:hypothetical protein